MSMSKLHHQSDFNLTFRDDASLTQDMPTIHLRTCLLVHSFIHSFTARPDIQMLVNTETINGLHYQSVLCSAVGGRPLPQISWLVKGLPASDYPFTVDVSDTVHSNGTSTLSSILRFPTHLQDEESVTCVVQHPTLPNPKLTTVRVETYSKLTLTAECVSVCVTSQSFVIMHHDSASHNTIRFSSRFFTLVHMHSDMP